MSGPSDGLARSVHVRLARHARAIGVDPNLVLTRYAVERFLYRLSRSPYAEKFVLKGALLMLVWLGETLRPTSDADLLGFGDLSDEVLVRVLGDVAALMVEPDAVDFIADSVRVEPIRVEDDYGGRRATIQARVGAARLTVRVDIGMGDAVTPAHRMARVPGATGLAAPAIAGLPTRNRGRREVARHRAVRAEEQPDEGLLRPTRSRMRRSRGGHSAERGDRRYVRPS
jgi:hypothetical protein